MYEVKINDIKLELVKNDIVKQPDLEAVVNAANAELRIGGGVAGAIHRAAGPELTEETRPLAPIQPGQAVITGGHNLDNDYIIHTLGPVYGRDKPEVKLLKECYQNSLKVTEDSRLNSIGFPAISTGAFGYPIEPAADISMEAIKDYLDKINYLKTIRFVLFNQSDFEVYKKAADK
ncbi:MAG: macro domain-containing protein, partial [Halarsenatibacteraceae bacterium]